MGKRNVTYIDPDGHSTADGSDHPGGLPYEVHSPDRSALAKLHDGVAYDLRWGAQRVDDSTDVVLLGLDIGDPMLRNGAKYGRRAAVHLLRECGPAIGPAWASEQARVPHAYGDRRLVVLVRELGRLPQAPALPEMIDEPTFADFVRTTRGHLVTLPSGEQATILGLLDDVVEEVAQTVTPLFVLVAQRAGKAFIAAYRSGINLRPTRRPRGTFTAWLASDGPDVSGSRACLEEDARRLGARILFACRGALPVAPARSVADEVVELRRRLDELTGTTTSSQAPGADSSKIFSFGDA